MNLVGIGLYTPREAQRLIGVPTPKIVRWLKGHTAKGKRYDPLWRPQVDLGDGEFALGFRDLMEMRTAAAFMASGVSAQVIRRAIVEARKLVGADHPLSTTRFRTDGRSVFLEIAQETGGGGRLHGPAASSSIPCAASDNPSTPNRVCQPVSWLLPQKPRAASKPQQEPGSSSPPLCDRPSSTSRPRQQKHERAVR